jgi:hypothetical protein
MGETRSGDIVDGAPAERVFAIPATTRAALAMTIVFRC